mmetsp:Transcript_52564/g.112558  ORF Transcript_52564/g.112558 Transcript_52564/m.112558 type:complete len:562 (+) Transcript_52564:2-1687(+)
MGMGMPMGGMGQMGMPGGMDMSALAGMPGMGMPGHGMPGPGMPMPMMPMMGMMGMGMPMMNNAGTGPGGDLGAMPQLPELPKQLIDSMPQMQSATPAQAAATSALTSEANAAAEREILASKRCHLHSKPQWGCKLCQKFKYHLRNIAAQKAVDASSAPTVSSADSDLVPLVNPIPINPVLKDRISTSVYFKSLFRLTTVEQVIDEIYNEADHAEPYSAGSQTIPSTLWCCMSRLFTLKLTRSQIFMMLEHTESPFIRAAGFLYVRVAVDLSMLWDFFGPFIVDEEEFNPTSDPKLRPVTMGEWIEQLMNETKFAGTTLPRLSVPAKRKLDEKLALVPQFRQRLQANKANVSLFETPGTRIEANSDGDWLDGTVVQVIDDVPSRMRVRCELEDGTEEVLSIGKVILKTRNHGGRSRSRSRNRDGGVIDWTRSRGPSKKRAVEELQQKQKESAVVSAGKSYAKRPLGYKALLAVQREGSQDSNTLKLQVEETSSGAATTRGRGDRPAESAVDEMESMRQRDQTQRAIFSKYGGASRATGGKTSLNSSSSNAKDDGGIDRMRFG